MTHGSLFSTKTPVICILSEFSVSVLLVQTIIAHRHKCGAHVLVRCLLSSSQICSFWLKQVSDKIEKKTKTKQNNFYWMKYTKKNLILAVCIDFVWTERKSVIREGRPRMFLCCFAVSSQFGWALELDCDWEARKISNLFEMMRENRKIWLQNDFVGLAVEWQLSTNC